MSEDIDPELEALRKKKMEQLQMLVDKEKEKTSWPSTTIPIGDPNFQEIVKKYPILLIDFWAPWCAPCKMIGPILEQLAGEFQGKVVIAKLDVDQNPGVASAFSVKGIPTMIMFKDGQPVERVTGALPRNTLKGLIERYLHEDQL